MGIYQGTNRGRNAGHCDGKATGAQASAQKLAESFEERHRRHERARTWLHRGMSIASVAKRTNLSAREVRGLADSLRSINTAPRLVSR